MSVRMALAKLCACACGGAIVGGGAVHVAERPAAKHVVRRTVHHAPVRKKVVTKTQTACAPATVTVTSQGAPIPLPPAPVISGDT